VKRGDKQTFLELRDKRIPPPAYTTLFVYAGSALAVLMGMEYPDAASGLYLVSSTSYLLSFAFFMIWEMDDPCTSGIWRIQNIPREWLEADLQAWHCERSVGAPDKL